MHSTVYGFADFDMFFFMHFCRKFLFTWLYMLLGRCTQHTFLYDLHIFCSHSFLYQNFYQPGYLCSVIQYTLLCEYPILSTKIFLYVFVPQNVYAYSSYFANKIRN